MLREHQNKVLKLVYFVQNLPTLIPTQVEFYGHPVHICIIYISVECVKFSTQVLHDS